MFLTARPRRRVDPARILQLSLQTRVFMAQAANRRRVVHNLIDLYLVGDVFGARRELERAQCLVGMHRRLRDAAQNRRPRVAPERSLQDACKLAVAVRNVAPAIF